jgi:glucan 1,3-beta-glucosidase
MAPKVFSSALHWRGKHTNVICFSDCITDDTAAINNAILAGGRCGEGCGSSTTTPAVVYFPAGTYLISSSILDQYYTMLIGDPTNVPTIKATAGFSGFGLIDGDKYYSAGLELGLYQYLI